MYTLNQLYTKIHHSLRWNALYYITYKIFFTALSFLLFYQLSSHHFALWANINSTIYLILLWLDLGLSKSVARYSPTFSTHHNTIERFVRLVLKIKAAVLLGATPLLYVLLRYGTAVLGLHASIPLCLLGAAIFLSEGLVSVLKRLYHAQFWYKEFNVMATVLMLIRALASLAVAWLLSDVVHIVLILFVLKLCESVILCVAGIIRLSRLHKSLPQQRSSVINFDQNVKEFAVHSGVMWSTTIAKSISERNMLVPLFTYLLGPAAAGTFKVANDAALFFQRPIIKSIGTIDTSALTHTAGAALSYVQRLFKTLVLPLAGLLLVLFVCSFKPGNEHISTLFYLLASCYLFEILFLPYERYLEVKRYYRELGIAYTVFLLLISSIFVLFHAYHITLLSIIMLICGARLIFITLITYLARSLIVGAKKGHT